MIDKATACQLCNEAEAVTFRYGMRLCKDCWEVKDRMDEQQRSLTAPHIPNNPLLAHAAAIDASVTVKTDIFNAETVAIAELKKAIEEDDTILPEQKLFQLATVVQNRIQNYKQIVFDLQQTIVDESNRQRANMQYLNQLAQTLRAEEREKLKAMDLSYKPIAPKLPSNKPARVPKASSAKISQAELIRAAQETGMEPNTIKSFCVLKGWTIDVAIVELKKVIAAGKGQ